jgi:pimeloyl-ACP methyl ester carboxylesterase
VGTNFDIVGFDPRGLGRSIPTANCSSSNTSLRRRAFGLYGPELSTSYWTQTFEADRALGAECEAAIGSPDDAGPHMSTAVVARDMLSIVDAFAATESGRAAEGSSLLNYWGISYGTFIGETFASIYPDRVGRVVLDGKIPFPGKISSLTSARRGRSSRLHYRARPLTDQ